MSFPFDLHSAAVSDSHMPCHAHALLRPCRSSQGHGTAWPSRDGRAVLKMFNYFAHHQEHKTVCYRLRYNAPTMLPAGSLSAEELASRLPAGSALGTLYRSL